MKSLTLQMVRCELLVFQAAEYFAGYGQSDADPIARRYDEW